MAGQVVMSNFGQVQVPEDVDEGRLAIATARDHRVRELEKQHVACWSEMAELVKLVEEQQDWRILNYQSFSSWLKSAAPQSRSAMYAAKGLLDELKDLPQEELRQIPLGNAKVLAAVPKRSRTKGLLTAAKTERPQKFRAQVDEKFPDLHLETVHNWTFKFKKSQRKRVRMTLDMAKILDAEEMLDDDALEDSMSDEEAFEEICEYYRDARESEFEQIKAGK
jgi:hypothetical protein